MSNTPRAPEFQPHFEEIGRLEEALRLNKLDGEQASEALRRIYEIMNWPVGPNTPVRATAGRA